MSWLSTMFPPLDVLSKVNLLNLTDGGLNEGVHSESVSVRFFPFLVLISKKG